MKKKRLLLKGCRFVVTQNPKREILEGADILLENERIARIGNIPNFDDSETLDCSHHLVLPGLINLHTHTITNLLRGISDDLPLKEWLEKKVWPAEAKIDELYYGAMLTCIESIKNGSTCFMDMSFSMPQVIKAVRQSGIRAFLGHGMIDFGDEQKRREELRESQEFIKAIKGDPLITATIAPHAPNTCSEDLLRESSKMAKKLGLLCQIHILETRGEKEQFEKEKGTGVIEYLERIGFLNEHTLGIHMCWLDKNGAKLLAKHGCSGVHCPTSNMKLATGARMPVEQLAALNVNVGLGTDSTASNNSLDLFAEMKQVGLLHKSALVNPKAMPTQTILDMATLNAGRILGLKLGAIIEGHLGDLIVINLRNPRLTPICRGNVISHLVYSVSGSDVSHTIVNGRIIMKDRQIVAFDEPKSLASIQEYFESRKLGEVCSDKDKTFI